MILGGIDFGPAWAGSGALGFWGEGYRFHRLYDILCMGMFCPEKLTLTAKTTTLYPRRGKTYGEEGNMELSENGISPKHLFPDCIKIGMHGFLGGYALNAVGLAGLGAKELLARDQWQNLRAPFFLSFMSLEKGDKAIEEMRAFKDLLKAHLPFFHAPVGLQINLSCPNAGVDLDAAAREAITALDIFSELGIPLVLKFNTLISVEVVCKICEHPACDAIIISNTIPWGKEEKKIPWTKLFGNKGESPLARYGGGGLSGAPLLPLICDWIKAARKAGITKPINAGGGILHPRDVDRVKAAGADGISVASALMLRPWRLSRIIGRAHEVFDNQQGGVNDGDQAGRK